MSNELFDISKFPKKDVRRMSWKSIEEYIQQKRTDKVLFWLINYMLKDGEFIVSGSGCSWEENGIKRYDLVSDTKEVLDGIGEVWAFCEYPKRLKNFDSKEWTRDE